LAIVEEEIAGDSDAEGYLGCWGYGYLDWFGWCLVVGGYGYLDCVGFVVGTYGYLDWGGLGAWGVVRGCVGLIGSGGLGVVGVLVVDDFSEEFAA
jgi:hypothetical protein